MVVNGIDVTIEGLHDVSEQEITNYIGYVEQQTNERLESLNLSAAADGNVAIDYVLQPQKFERIRRITGYLVGTIDRWNNAKRAEEHDRVKHGMHWSWNFGLQVSSMILSLMAMECGWRSLPRDARITALAVITKKHGILMEVESLQLKLSPLLYPAYMLMEFIEIYV